MHDPWRANEDSACAHVGVGITLAQPLLTPQKCALVHESNIRYLRSVLTGTQISIDYSAVNDNDAYVESFLFVSREKPYHPIIDIVKISSSIQVSWVFISQSK